MIDLSGVPEPVGRLAEIGGLMVATFREAASSASVPCPDYIDDPVGFARDELGIEPWGRWEGMPAASCSQVEALEAIRDFNFVALRSGHKIGKSNIDAITALWWVMTRRGGRVTLTAPANHQVESILWVEIRLIFQGQHPAQKKKPDLPGKLYVDCRSGLQLADGWGIVGLTTDTKERMAGKSGALQLYIVDEASGYPEPIFEAVFGNLAGGGKVLMTGNPTAMSGTFYGAFHEKAAQWKRLHVSSLDTPNFHGGNIPGLAGPDWHTWALSEWGGPGNAIYDVRVLGQFPTQNDNAVVPLLLVELAKGRWAEAEEDEDIDLGVDVAREGDDESIIAPVRGRKALPLVAVAINKSPEASPPGHQVGDGVAREARRLVALAAEKAARCGRGPCASCGERMPVAGTARPCSSREGWCDPRANIRKPRIKIDAIGVGTAVLDHMMATYSNEFDIIGINSALPADKDVEVAPGKTAYQEYRNLRTQMGFGLAKWLRSGAIPEDGKLEAELVAPVFLFVDGGKLAIEEKSQIKKRLKRSPDRADALALAIYSPPQMSDDYWSAKAMSDHRSARSLPQGRGRSMYR